MKKFMNTAETMVAESVEGFVRAHEAFVVFGPERRCIRRRHLTPGKVALISGGGAGIGLFDGGDDLARCRRGEDMADARGIQHALADKADMHRFMAGAAA